MCFIFRIMLISLIKLFLIELLEMMLYKYYSCIILTKIMITMEALVSGHPQGTKRMSLTGAGGLRECKNTEVVWELRKTGFVKAVVSRAVFPYDTEDVKTALL